MIMLDGKIAPSNHRKILGKVPSCREESRPWAAKNIMAKKKKDSLAREKEEPKIEVHDLKPEKDFKGGARSGTSGEKQPSAKTGEIDFMHWD